MNYDLWGNLSHHGSSLSQTPLQAVLNAVRKESLKPLAYKVVEARNTAEKQALPADWSIKIMAMSGDLSIRESDITELSVMVRNIESGKVI